jgi:hypothetical protein
LKGERLPLLISYPYLTADMLRQLLAHQDSLDLFVDCGAFTAFAKGKHIDLDDYCRFLKALPFTPWRYMALDVIGDPERTWENYQTMLARGFTDAVPVLTRNTPEDHLEGFYRTADLVALGGLATKTGSPYRYVRSVMGRAAGRKVHLLGATNMGWLKHLAPYSADSSTWEDAARYGHFNLYLGGGLMKTVTRKSMMKAPTEEVVHSVRGFGLDPFELQRDSAWRGGNSLTRYISASSWIALARDFAKRVGTRVFLAAAATDAVRALIQVHLWQTEGRAIQR